MTNKSKKQTRRKCLEKLFLIIIAIIIYFTFIENKKQYPTEIADDAMAFVLNVNIMIIIEL